MFHAVSIKHGPETCPAVHSAPRGAALDGLDNLPEEARTRDISVVGAWADMPGHRLYMIVDAPNAHVVTEMATALGFGSWATVDVRAVVDVSVLHERLRAVSESDSG